MATNLNTWLEERNFNFDGIDQTNDGEIRTKLKQMKWDELMNRNLRWTDCRTLQAKLYGEDEAQERHAVKYKIFNDAVHGSIRIHQACVAIIDTPQFQRLRNLKQLGACHFVYPAAAHNRFEHCIGVCHLAGQVACTLRENQPYLGITDIDILCVEIAGLCHDLGHGPFSHVFEGKVIPKLKSRRGIPSKPKWKHEQMSVTLFDYLLKKNNLWYETDNGSLAGELTKYGLEKNDIEFIKEMINPEEGEEKRGRGKEKAYLYEIVANSRNGIDVDKWDYLARDSLQLGIPNNFDHKRYMSFARVAAGANEELQICTRDKEILGLYNMFATRFALHRAAYKHKVTCAVDAMIVDALVACGDVKLIPGSGKRNYSILECIDDVEAYTNLTDSVLDIILHSVDEELRDAKEIINKIKSRQLYTLVRQSNPMDPDNRALREPGQIERQVLDIIRERQPGDVDSVELEDFFVETASFDFGMGPDNPLDSLNCYSKSEPLSARVRRSEEVSQILVPSKFKEQMLRVYCRSGSPEKRRLIGEAYDEWFSNVNQVMAE